MSQAENQSPMSAAQIHVSEDLILSVDFGGGNAFNAQLTMTMAFELSHLLQAHAITALHSVQRAAREASSTTQRPGAH